MNTQQAIDGNGHHPTPHRGHQSPSCWQLVCNTRLQQCLTLQAFLHKHQQCLTRCLHIFLLTHSCATVTFTHKSSMSCTSAAVLPGTQAAMTQKCKSSAAHQAFVFHLKQQLPQRRTPQPKLHVQLRSLVSKTQI